MMRSTLLATVSALALCGLAFGQGVTVQQLPVDPNTFSPTTTFWCGDGAPPHTYQCPLTYIWNYGLGLNNTWTGSNTFSGGLTLPSINGAVTISNGSSSSILALNQTAPGSFNTDLIYEAAGTNLWDLSARPFSNSGDYHIFNYGRSAVDLSIGNSTGIVTLGQPLPHGSGGTGVGGNLTAGQILIGNGTSGGFNVNTLNPGSGITITNADGNITIAEAGSTGTITAVTAGTGLSGGGASGNVTLTVTNPYNPASVAVTGGSVNGAAIGNAAASSVASTTLSASGAVSGAGFTALLGAPSSIGNVTPGTGAFTTGCFTTGIIGVTGNSTAPAGDVGEVKQASVACSATTGLTSDTVASIANITLTGGDWDIYFGAGVIGTTTTVLSGVNGGISTSPTTLPTGGTPGSAEWVGSNQTNAIFGVAIEVNGGPLPVQLAAGNTTEYVNVLGIFNTSTAGGCGYIVARRRR